MSHVTCTQVNRVDFQLLMVGSQTANLTLGFSFCHNLCFRCPNGSCKFILDIYVSIVFNDIKNSSIHWFWPLQSFSEHSGVHPDSNSQSGSSLGSVRVYSLTLSCTLGNMQHDSRASFWARNLATPCFSREPKARVTSLCHIIKLNGFTKSKFH